MTLTPGCTPLDLGPATGQAAQVVTCARCGLTVDELPLSWSTSLERGRTVYYCDRCSRENVRAIEGRLDSEWW